ncbi:RAB11-binding protein RELCH homolog [Diadema antillarum]|uniref:RAB11-binding protein RELCH homolog n=1 Tax=Diadema antillarum TaxID=105358 RepID=UPI003A8637B1
MADYNPFFEDTDGEIDDSIVAAVEDEKPRKPATSSESPRTPERKDELNYDSIAVKLLKDNLLLSALELHTELTENGRQLPRLRDYFSNPGNFEKQAERGSPLVGGSLYRTSSETTFDSLDMARYSDDGNNQVDEKCAVLEFELRKARETIKSLRANLTEAAESDIPSPVHSNKDPEGNAVEEATRPLERRAVNFLVNEYLMNNNYKLTSITFADENEDQDFDDWDDVGLNTPRPPDLLHLYRDYSRHVIVRPETREFGCGEDSIDEEQPEAVEADLNMSIEQQRQHYEAEMEDMDKQMSQLRLDKEELLAAIEKMEREITTLKTPKQSTPSISPITSPIKDPASIASERGERREPIGQEMTDDTPHISISSSPPSNQVEALQDISEPVAEDEDGDGVGGQAGEDDPDAGPPLVNGDERSGEGQEEDRGEVEGQGDEQAETGDGFFTRRKNVSEAFQRALLGTVVHPVETTEARLLEEVSHIAASGQGIVEMLARCLPHIIPNVLLAKREELVPLILCAASSHPEARERDQLLNLLFNLIKKPDEDQRQVILSGCVAFAKHVGPTKAEAELLPQCWEQINHKYLERRLLVAESCGALAPYLPKEICSSLVLSMLQQMLEDRAEEIRSSAVKSLGLVFSLIDDTDKYNQGLDLLLKALGDSSDGVVNATQQVFLPAFAAWAQDLNRLETNLVSTVLKRLEVTAIDLQRPKPDILQGERLIQHYAHTLQCLVPAVYANVLQTGPFEDDLENGREGGGEEEEEEREEQEEEEVELEVTRFPKPLCALHNVSVIMGGQKKLVGLMEAFERYTRSEETETWPSYNWVITDYIPRLLEVVGRLDAVHTTCVRSLSKLFVHICKTFGPAFTDSKVTPKFLAVLNVPKEQYYTLVQSGQSPIAKATLPAFVCGVLTSHHREDDRQQINHCLQEAIVIIGQCQAPQDSVHMAFNDLHANPTYHELLLATLWSCVVNTSSSVRILTARLFELLARGINEALVSSRVVPALITLSGDSDISVRIATIPAFGTILENTNQKETLDRVYTQFQTFLDETSHKQEHALIVQVINTLGKIGPNAEPKFRDEFILPRLAAMAYTNSHSANDANRAEVATALFEAYSAISCCFVSEDLIREAMLPGLRCLRKDMETVLPEHEGVVSSMIKDFESKIQGKERTGSFNSMAQNIQGHVAHLGEDARKSIANKFGAQKTKMGNVFARKKKTSTE